MIIVPPSSVFLPHVNEKRRFSDSSRFEERLTVEIKLRFQMPPGSVVWGAA